MPGYEVFEENEEIRYSEPDPVKIYIAKVVKLRKFVHEDLESLESSFEAAKRNMDQIQHQIKEVRAKIESTTATRITDLDEEAKLEALKKEVRNLKTKIPYNLIHQQLNVVDHPNVVSHPRTSNTTVRSNHASSSRDKTYDLRLNSRSENLDMKLAQCNPNFYFLHQPGAPTSPSNEELCESLKSLRQHGCCSRILECLGCFPVNVIIKRTLLFYCLGAHSESPSLDWDQFDVAMNKFTAVGFLKPICKKSTLSVSSYWMHHKPSIFLGPYFCKNPQYSIHLSPLPSEEQEILYSENLPIIERKKYVKALLLGKWHRSLPLSQHIEVADPKLFYKGMEKLTKVKYISLRGISMIPKLPQFITKLKKLQILDCKACHDLEVIPDNINKLWRTLTHLDMSDCYLLDHMPTTLSELVHLQVLKGFHIGESDQRKTCTLRNLTKLSKLQKLHIYTSAKGFPNTDQLADLQKFPSLRNLGISWRESQAQEESTTIATTVQGVLTHKDSTGGGGDQQQFSFDFEKLDLQCVPNTVTRVWLNPVVFKGLKKLYIRGGSFFDLGQKLDEPKQENTPLIAKENQWNVEILRLKHLRELKMDKSELDNLFPKLITLENVDCPNLISGRSDDNNIWIKHTHRPPTTSLLVNLDQ